MICRVSCVPRHGSVAIDYLCEKKEREESSKKTTLTGSIYLGSDRRLNNELAYKAFAWNE
jgi:hypothetical protein